MKKILGLRLVLLVLVVAQPLFGYITWEMYEARHLVAPIWVYVATFILLILFLISSVIRCHQLTWSGWRVVGYIIPLAGFILLLLLLMKKSVLLETPHALSADS